MARIPKISLTSQVFRERPIEEFGKLRQQGPVIRVKLPFVGKCWLATTFDAVSSVLRETKQFVRQADNAGKKFFTVFEFFLPKVVRSLMKSMINRDEPDHRRLRSLVEKAFVKKSVDSMADRLDELAQHQIQFAIDQAEQNRLDLVEGFARPFPLAVITELLGLPDEDRPKFTKWFSGFSNIRSFWQIFTLFPSLNKVKKYLVNRFEYHRVNKDDSLICALVDAEESGDRLDEDELVAMVMLLLMAGHETTVHLISNCLLTLVQHSDVKQQLVDQWEHSDTFVDEVLRFASPVQYSKPRFVKEDIEFHGEHLKRGELIMGCIASANLDPEVFPEPDKFQIDRKPNRHLDFGAGPHICLGLKLAKLETKIAIRTLLEKLGDLKPTFDANQPAWSKRIGFRSLKSFQVEIPD